MTALRLLDPATHKEAWWEREESNLHLDRIRVACSPFYYVPTGGEDENLASWLLSLQPAALPLDHLALRCRGEDSNLQAVGFEPTPTFAKATVGSCPP